ncbi:MAG TPA: GNAT family N-acetyltransferase [Candidatus Dormibacteraeota bacterium]|nr:GNAT family N-acetyltransferase [Candidatus Dormibacteraeota bacterium]
MPGVTYREATLDDAALASDLMTAAYPPMPQDPVTTEFRWRNLRKGFVAGRFIAERDGVPAAFLGWLHGPWHELPDRHCEVEVWLSRDQLDVDLLAAMWTFVEDRAAVEEPHLLLAYAGEDESEMLESLARCGFQRERLEKVWELDLRANGARLMAEAAEALQEMSNAGIALTTLAGWADPDKLRKLHQLDRRTRHDIPTSVAIVSESYEDFERRTNGPDRRADRYWVAIAGDQPVAMSYLRFPPVRGPIWTGYTCSDPAHRGRGIARAIKLQSLAQAVELGVPYVLTDNDSQNAPMLHINERLGYVRRPGFVEHHKRVDKDSA